MAKAWLQHRSGEHRERNAMFDSHMGSNAFVTNTATFLPGPPIANDEIESVLGMVGGKPSRARSIVLRSNGIKRRHYVLDRETGKPTHSNATLTAAAVRGLNTRDFDVSEVDCLACGTSSPDQMVPNHAVMVHGEVGNPACEVVATAGVCLAGFTAFKYAYLSVIGGQAANAVSTGSEVASLSLHARNFAGEVEASVARLEQQPEIAFEKDFLRWMLSDGAGAMLIQNQPRRVGISLRIDWVDAFSYAHRLPVCMYAGGQKTDDHQLVGWRNFKQEELLSLSLLSLRQDVRLLNDNIAKYACAEPLKILMKKRGLRGENVDWVLPHLSSMYFREPIARACTEVGFNVPLERWFTNLTTKGNTGSASAYIILDELFHSGRLKVGDRILLAVPESGRFSSGFAHFTVV
jgi:3-oxoacyl-[acyl-carrier-protein] synthase-3